MKNGDFEIRNRIMALSHNGEILEGTDGEHNRQRYMGRHSLPSMVRAAGKDDANRKRSFFQLINQETEADGCSNKKVIRNKCQSCEEYAVLLDYYRTRVNELEARVRFMTTLIKQEAYVPDTNESYEFEQSASMASDFGVSPVSGKADPREQEHHETDASALKESLKLRIYRPQGQPTQKEQRVKEKVVVLDENHNDVTPTSNGDVQMQDQNREKSKENTDSSVEVAASEQHSDGHRTHTIKVEPIDDLDDSGTSSVAPTDPHLPRSGLMDAETARKYNMIELLGGTGVYWTPTQMFSCLENSRDNPCKLLSLMVDVFFTKAEMKCSSAHGQGRYRALDKTIINAILVFVERHYFKLPAAKITQVINNKCAHVRRGPRTGLYTRYKMQRQMRRVAVEREIEASMVPLVVDPKRDDITDEEGMRWEIEVADAYDGGFADGDVISDSESIGAEERIEFQSTKQLLKDRTSHGKR